jgi:hypothetical protein
VRKDGSEVVGVHNGEYLEWNRTETSRQGQGPLPHNPKKRDDCHKILYLIIKGISVWLGISYNRKCYWVCERHSSSPVIRRIYVQMLLNYLFISILLAKVVV